MNLISRRPPSALRSFLGSGAAGGVLLMVAAALAMAVANSPLAPIYHHWLHEPLGPVLSEKLGPMTLHVWINDGLMAVFFLLVGLEIKRELVDDGLSSWADRRLAFLAAASGMIIPAAIYLFFVAGNPGLVSGWAIPAATDIAFAIGVLALLGRRAPASLKLFLTTVAIVDDMGAVAIIAFVYTADLNLPAIASSAAILAAMYALNRGKVMTLWAYLPAGAALWYFVLLSGIHATVAGVLIALMIPIIKTRGTPDSVHSPLHVLEHAISPWVAFLIVPIFGFANAGVSVAGLGLQNLIAPMPLGIAAGLFLGKQIGIFGAVWVATRIGIAVRPRGATWVQVYAVAMLCGIGFTMSLFIGPLAFPGNEALVEEAKIGVLTGSLASAVLGYVILRIAPPYRLRQPNTPSTRFI